MDINKFMQAPLERRTKTVDVPELKEFYGEDEEPKWIVRALTAAELGRAKQTAEMGAENARAAVEALSGSVEKADAVRKLLGISDKEVPGDITRRIEMLCAGSVSPEIGEAGRDAVVRLSEMYPTTFYNLTNIILSLTGEGAELGKRKPSGKTQK